MLQSEVWKKGISIDVDSGPLRHVFWCCGRIYHQLHIFFSDWVWPYCLLPWAPLELLDWLSLVQAYQANNYAGNTHYELSILSMLNHPSHLSIKINSLNFCQINTVTNKCFPTEVETIWFPPGVPSHSLMPVRWKCCLLQIFQLIAAEVGHYQCRNVLWIVERLAEGRRNNVRKPNGLFISYPIIWFISPNIIVLISCCLVFTFFKPRMFVAGMVWNEIKYELHA